MPPLPRCQASDSRGRARALLDRGGGLGGEEHSLEQRGRWRGGRGETTSEQHAPTAYVPGYAKIWGWATVLTTKGERVGGGAGHRPPAFSSAARGEGRQLSKSTCWRTGRAPKGRGGGGAHGPPAKGAGNASPRRKASGRPLQHSQAHPSAPQPSPAPPPRLPTSHAQANTVNGAGGALSSGGHPPPSSQRYFLPTTVLGDGDTMSHDETRWGRFPPSLRRRVVHGWDIRWAKRGPPNDEMGEISPNLPRELL